jgi:hypothetical protein
MSLYGGLLRLYPRDFREEYGEDMEQLLREQLGDESAARVWGRAVLDLALTVPSLRLEAHMSRSAPAPAVYGTAAVTCLVVAAVAGSTIGVSMLALAGLLLFGTLGTIAMRRAHALGDGSQSGAHWWKYAAAGAAGVTTVAVIGSQVDELPDGAWFAFMSALLASVILLATGLVMGLIRLTTRRRPA